jgi:hypothetical protein
MGGIHDMAGFAQAAADERCKAFIIIDEKYTHRSSCRHLYVASCTVPLFAVEREFS